MSKGAEERRDLRDPVGTATRHVAFLPVSVP